MKLSTLFLTKNNCYKSGKKHTIKGIMVHSTGANNPKLSRYVGPDDGVLGPNPYNNHWNQPTPGDRSVCVHAFIGKDKNGEIRTYQTLPWDMVGWHSGSGSLGAAKNANNNGYIGFEICEDGLIDRAYFDKVYQEAVELCAYLCKTYGIKPDKPTLICHSEGHQLGIASNHGDVMHWFPKHGKNMDTFRAAVKAVIAAEQKPAGTPIIGKATATAAQAATWAKRSGATDLFISLADTFWKIAQTTGVNPVAAYVQSAKETGYGQFKGVLDESFRNPCGLKTSSGGANNDPNAHKHFNSWEEGIAAQLDHLALYAGASGYPKPGTHDPRHFPYLKGTAKTVEELGGKWAPAATYGTDIVAMMAKLEVTKAAPVTPPPVPPEVKTLYYVQTGAYSIKANADAQHHKVKAAGFDAIIKKAGNLYRVQVGAYSVRANADAQAAKLKAAGFETYVTTTGGTQVAAGTAPAPTPAPAKNIAVGSKVNVKAGAKTYAGGNLASFVYQTTYDVQQITGDRAVIGLKGKVTAAVRLGDLIIQ